MKIFDFHAEFRGFGVSEFRMAWLSRGGYYGE